MQINISKEFIAKIGVVFFVVVLIGCAVGPERPDGDNEEAMDEELEDVGGEGEEHWTVYKDEFSDLEEGSEVTPLGEGSSEQTVARLEYLKARDQFWREKTLEISRLQIGERQREDLLQRVEERIERIDRENTTELSNYLKENRWPAIEEMGPEADRAAWIITQHADHNVEFQEDVLNILEPLVEDGQTHRGNFALLFDRVAMNQGEPQRFGTQGECQADGSWEMYEVENPDELDERRMEMGVQPMEEYRALVEGMCSQTPDASE